MATILRESYRVEVYRKRYQQVDPVPNLLTFFPQIKPFGANESLPERVEPRKWAQDFQQPNFQTQGIPVPAVQAVKFRAPLFVPIFARPRLQPDQFPNLVDTLYALSAPKPPFYPPLFPEVYRRIDRDFLQMETLSYLPGPVSAPYVPVDFPTPMRAKAVPQDFIFSTTSIPPLAPFNQDDWPEAYKRRAHLQDFFWSGTTTRNIPAGVVEPFLLNDWPLPLPKKWAQADSQSSPHILLITPVLAPFAQSDFPNPHPRRRLREDWIWPGTITRGIPPIPPPAGPFATVILEGYWNDLGSLILRWSASLGAAGYRLYINGVQQPQILTQRFTTVTALAIDTPYVFNIVCVNTFGDDASILSNPVYFEHGSNEIGTYHTRPWN